MVSFPEGGLSFGPEAVKFGAPAFQPTSGLVHARHGLLHEPPEFRPVIHFAEMSHFVGGYVIKNMRWRKDEPPRE
jgi:hypothetical protein